ncbi:sensor histidine kinase [Facklamia sp. DSM 111018]|uniref:Sensor histidine kinase n=1 Tax=Facklamia lactis TaxID=2749967 RepID=A0ABS0LNJ5_9LACT|nr:sensor histidine kinase [Facklamia lactis]MBG9985723.1 sensor histidine kinase [Facklamia lactis]
MFIILLHLIQRASLIVILAYLLMTTAPLQKAMLTRYQVRSKLILFLVLGIFAIISNMFGIVVEKGQVLTSPPIWVIPEQGSLANSRVLAISVSGLVGGPLVGLSVGLVTGLFRYLQGGLSPHIYFISSVTIGFLSGLFGRQAIKRQTFPQPFQGFICAATMELLQMVLILVLSHDSQASWNLVKMIIMPMVLVNSIGAGLFLSIIQLNLRQEVSTRAIQTHHVLDLTNATLSYFSAGLTQDSAQTIAQLIYDAVNVSAISITNQEEVLAYIGQGADHHLVGQAVTTDLTLDTLQSGHEHLAHSKAEIGCHQIDCPLTEGIIVPLQNHHETLGTLKFYFTEEIQMTEIEEQLAVGLGRIFSMQLRLGLIQQQKDLLKQAELKSLQAQVNPHFFFNAINTISAIMRFDTEKARRLLLKLSDYFRASLQGNQATLISLAEELKHVQAYLEIEEARFPDRVQVDFEIEEACQDLELPPFTLQILIENAIRHAFPRSDQAQAQIQVKIYQVDEGVRIEVEDNGKGIPANLLSILGQEPITSEKGSGTALYNLSQRIKGLYEMDPAINITSQEHRGSKFSILLPNKRSGR